ncbi:hypothetical protein RchiOBHm_Chr2g0145671 [Rosa chinensis]|uniref:Uncharacterized protein n=1 Tax=Rosa chinensis TaxID=74649 RepID=A0A2P6RYQ1_ROSCH|nr:hypothetical protein RchiOBHm_Chr2g0145671 [Rosa chinensis]
MSAGAKDNFQNQFWAGNQDSGSIHSFYDVAANPDSYGKGTRFLRQVEQCIM